MNRLTLSLVLPLLIAASCIAQDSINPTERLTKQSEQFQEQIIKVADNVYTAVGYSVSNVSMIVGDDGVVIVDTGMMLETAERIATGVSQTQRQAGQGDHLHSLPTAITPAGQRRFSAKRARRFGRTRILEVKRRLVGRRRTYFSEGARSEAGRIQAAA